ncbi:MAG: penicillin-binding transpeptidase domain-containing protein [Glaciecola sp.]|jgi:cell division protein FtsI (penicillin-binding protein 3)|nr:penicillin-binding transpeptidase domain-containing protein [Glaciecola sp.]MDG1469362.1 penicillin-binding transpeptidase domain-containing protein [Glaciecola sp.]MDG1923197.1 penicillin-binding transpeptidase domain-containing protein [Glaciecola sp.]
MTKQSKAAKTTQLAQAPATVYWRFVFVVICICLVFTGIGVRAAFIQVIEPDQLIKQGDNRTKRVREAAAHRGLIMDRNGQELAVSIPVQAIYADPKIIAQQNSLADVRRWDALAKVLKNDTQALMAKVSNPKRRFVYLQRQVTPAMANYVDELDIPGVYLRDESRRYYPSGEVSAHVIGFTNVDDKGIEGIEYLFNDYLTGTPDRRYIRRDGKGRQIELLKEKEGKKASDLVLTIDQRIQALAYKEIKKALTVYQARSASALVIDVETAEVLAMVNGPSYNPNNRKNTGAHRIRNRVVTDAFEPGSAVKPLAVLSALEFGVIKKDDIIDTNPGWMRLGGSRVQDSHNYGELDLRSIIQKSSNIGTTKLALSVPKEFLLDTYYNMGLMSDTGMSLLGESAGLFHERNRWSEFELATLSFGYGLSVTTAQLGRMYTTLANGGANRELTIIKHNNHKQTEQVFSAQNTQAVLEMMESVTQKGGSATKAAVAGYRVAGKTGTSRKAIAGGYGDNYVNIFAGVAPVSDPQIVVVVLINEPGGDLYYAGDTAAPVFSKIMGGALQLLNIAPDGLEATNVANLTFNQ